MSRGTLPARLPPVVATDLDGTIVRSDGSISARTTAALAAVEEAGSLVVLVTGRPPRWMAPVAAATGRHGLAICANGALVYDLRSEQVVEEHLLQPEQALQVLALLRAAVPGATYAVERGPVFGYEPSYAPRWPPPSDSLVDEVEALLSQPTAKMLVRHEDFDADALLARARDVIGGLVTMTHSSQEGLLEISAAGVSKASTLALLCEERGAGPADVVAFGDMPNDLPMLAWAGHGVAMANAHPEVLAAADEVTASNDDHGVALVLERMLAGG